MNHQYNNWQNNNQNNSQFNNQSNNDYHNYQNNQVEQHENIIDKQRKKQTRLMILGTSILVIALFGLTYAFFNYTRTGTANTIRVGKIAFNSNQTDTIGLTNVFPISSTDAQTDTTNTDEAIITITGDTTYSNGVEYILTATNVSNTVGSGQNAKTVPINIVVSGSSGLGTADDSYFTNRGGNTSVYKVLSNGTVTEDGQILVGYIASGQTGVNGSVTIKGYLDSSKIAISDTLEGTIRTVIVTGYSSSNCETALTGVTNASTYCATAASLQDAIDGEDLTDAQIELLVTAGIVDEYTNGTDSDWIGTRTVFTTEEWNSLRTNGISFKVKVEANEGIWVEVPPVLLYDAVKTMSIGTMNAGTDFGVVASSDTTNHPYGVYQLVESNLTNPIYFYRGDHTVKNNVIFDDKCWLVVRTTETNSTRILYNGTPIDGHCTTTEGNDTMISLYQSNSANSDGDYEYSTIEQSGYSLMPETSFKFNVNRNDAKYVGYTYDNGVDSNMKNALETWYEGAMSSEAKAKIETSTYCNDTTDVSEIVRSTYNITDTYTYFGAYLRAKANTPSVICPTGANAISSKVGFLTVDEEILAGRTWSSGMQDYLYNNSYWWLGSPDNFAYGIAVVFDVNSDYIAQDGYNVSYGRGLRPVVSILSNTTITGGDGSQTTPWIIG